MAGASNSEVLGDTSEGHRDEPVREEGSGLCDHQHHFSSLSTAAAQVRSNSLFSAIDADDSGRAPIETVVDYLESANGFSGVYHILTGGPDNASIVLQIEGGNVVDLGVLTRLLEDELELEVRSGREIDLDSETYQFYNCYSVNS